MGLYLNGKMVSPALFNGSSTGVFSVNGEKGYVTITPESIGALTQSNLQEATNAALAQAKTSGDFNGEKGDSGSPGEDGYSPTISIEETTDGVSLSIEDKNGTSSVFIKNGSDGSPGQDGETPEIEVGTVTSLNAGQKATASISKGADVLLLNLGIPKGADGTNGTTPVKGVDYFTSDDKTELLAGYATETFVRTQLQSAAEVLSDYATKTFVTTQIQSAIDSTWEASY